MSSRCRHPLASRKITRTRLRVYLPAEERTEVTWACGLCWKAGTSQVKGWWAEADVATLWRNAPERPGRRIRFWRWVHAKGA